MQFLELVKLLEPILQRLLQACRRFPLLGRLLTRLFQLGLGRDRHQEEDAEGDEEDVDQRNEKPRDAAARHVDHGASFGGRGMPPPRLAITSRPRRIIHEGIMLMRAMNRPEPVAVMAGA